LVRVTHGHGLSPDKVRILERVYPIHQTLQFLLLYTGKDAVIKARQNTLAKVARRVMAKPMFKYYKDISSTFGSNLALLRSASKMYPPEAFSKQETPKRITKEERAKEKEIATALAAILANRAKDVSDSGIHKATAVIARTTLPTAAASIGFNSNLPEEWDEDPVAMFDKVFPEQSSNSHRMSGLMLQTFIGVAAGTIARYANPARDFGGTLAQRSTNMGGVLKWAEAQTASRNAVNQAQKILNGVTAKVSTDAGAFRRRLITLEDNKVCAICFGDAAHGWVFRDETYPSGAAHPPGQHANCRCSEIFEELPPCPAVDDGWIMKSALSKAEGGVCLTPPDYLGETPQPEAKVPKPLVSGKPVITPKPTTLKVPKTPSKPSIVRPSGTKPVGNEWAKNLTERELKSIKNWNYGWDDMKGMPSEMKIFNQALSKSGEFEGTMYRGLRDLNKTQFNSIVNSSQLKLKGKLVSASRSRMVGLEFQQSTEEGGRGVLFKIKGKGVDITQASDKVYKYQREVIMSGDTSYKVVSKGWVEFKDYDYKVYQMVLEPV